MKVNASFHITVGCPNCGADVEVSFYNAKKGLKNKVFLCTVDVGPNGDAGCGEQFLVNAEINYNVKCASGALPKLDLEEVKSA